VDSLQVYTPEELYQQRIQGKTPETAEDHFRLAEFARDIGALEHARAHYQAVLDAQSPKYNQDAIRRLLERVEKRIGQKEAEAALLEIKQAIVYYQFEKVAALLAAFRQKYADEDLLSDAKELEEEAAERRTAHLVSLVPRTYLGEIKEALGRKLKTKDLALSEATRYAGGQVSAQDSASAEALLKAAEKLKLEPKEVLELWGKRPKRSAYKAFYGTATFMVVQSLKDPLAKVQPPKPTGKPGSKPAAVPKPHPMKNPDDWWKDKVAARSTTELRDFLYAWWAEKSGMVELLDPKEETCTTCNGKGYTAQMYQSAEGAIPYYDRCQVCFVATFRRVVQFR
jgi:hypothetical protein